MQRLTHLIALILMAGSLVACGGGSSEVPLPEGAISDDVVMLIWADVAALAPDKLLQTIDSVVDQMPPEVSADDRAQMKEQAREAMSEYRQMHQKIADAGATGLLIGMQAPASMMQEPAGFMLVRAGAGADAAKLKAAVTALPDGPEPDEVNIEPFADGWMVVTDNQGKLIKPTGGSAAAAGVFEEIFAQAPGAPIRMAFRMNDQMRQMLDKQGGQAAQANPMAAGMIGAMKKLNSISVAGYLGDNPRQDIVAAFEDAEAAEQFSDLLDGVLSMVKMMAAGSPEADAQAAAKLLNEIKLVQDGPKLSLSMSANTLLPAMGPAILNARAAAQQTASAANARQIITALIVYETDHGQLPESLGQLVEQGILHGGDVFLNPRLNRDDPPATIDAAWVTANSDYAYARPDRPLGQFSPQTILIYEKHADRLTDKLVVGFADGHTEQLPIDQARQRLEAAGIDVQ